MKNSNLLFRATGGGAGYGFVSCWSGTLSVEQSGRRAKDESATVSVLVVMPLGGWVPQKMASLRRLGCRPDGRVIKPTRNKMSNPDTATCGGVGQQVAGREGSPGNAEPPVRISARGENLRLREFKLPSSPPNPKYRRADLNKQHKRPARRQN